MIPLPAYIDKEAWEGFVEMRRAMPKSKPFTARAAILVLYELQRIKDSGYCPNAALDQSTKHGWADVYVPRDKPIERKAGSQAEETKQWLDSQRQTPEQRRASEDARRIAMGGLKVVRS